MWVQVHENLGPASGTEGLGRGERAAIALAQALRADLLLVDDRRATAAARRLRIESTGTIGVFLRAADRGLMDLEKAFAALRATNFRAPPGLLETLLAEDQARRGAPGR